MRKLPIPWKATTRNFIYFIAAWNAAGLCIYQWMKRGKDKGDPTWEAKTSAQKYLSLMGNAEDQVKVYKLRGLHSDDIKTEEATLGDFMVPEPPKPPEEK